MYCMERVLIKYPKYKQTYCINFDISTLRIYPYAVSSVCSREAEINNTLQHTN